MIAYDNIESMINHLTIKKLSNEEDQSFLNSVSQQILRKGLSLTDKQYLLLKEMLLKYKDLLETNGYNFDLAINTLSLGLRRVNRERKIELITENDKNLISVRFLFNRRLINTIKELRSLKGHYYEKENKTHKFPATLENVYKIINSLQDKNFEIDEKILELYEIAKNYEMNPHDYLPCIIDYKLKNFSKPASEYLYKKFGNPTVDNLIFYKDISLMFSIQYIERKALLESAKKFSNIAVSLATRENQVIQAAPDQFKLREIINGLMELNRFPILILLDQNKAFSQLKESIGELPEEISKDSISVMYRMDNKGIGKNYNQYVKENGLNNQVDKSTKVVYIIKTKLPKTLLKADWHPESIILINSSHCSSKINGFLNNVDLKIHYDNEMTSWRRIKAEKLTRDNAYM